MIKDTTKKHMKSTLTFFTACTLFTTAAFSQSSETRTLPSFSKIEIESIAKIHHRQDPVQSVQVSSKGMIDHVETTVKNGTLIISGSTDADLQISIPSVEMMSIEGKGEIVSESPLVSDELKLAISGD